jgi:predicted dehydrogenase
MTIRVAIAGAGFIADIHAEALKNEKDVELSAVVEKFTDKGQAFAQKHEIPHVFSSVEELIASKTTDALIIGTPNFLHAPQAIAALNAGMHVMVEKPMSMSVEEAEEMHHASQKNGTTLMIAHCWRYDEEVNWLKEQVENGKLGKIFRTKGYGSHEYWGPEGWFTQKELSGGGALVDMGIHAIDTARYIIGDPEPVSVYAHIDTLFGEYDVDDTGTIIIKWNNGVVSYIECGWWQPHMDGPEASTQIYGKKGFGSIFPTKVELPDYQKESLEVIDDGFEFPRKDQCPQIMYDQQMSHFINCIKNHETPLSDAIKGITNMKILAAAYESAEKQQVIFLNR